MSTPTEALILNLTDVQLAGLKTALMGRVDHCKDMIGALTSTKNDKTAIAHHWRTELATAEQLLAIVRKPAQLDSNHAATTPSTTNQEQA
jgi:hypothetical protein